MGNKIITEKDFWMCSGGNMPAPFQPQQKIAKKKSGEKFVTKIDTSTSSIIDFGCNKLMFIMAILAAVIAVVVVATGGAALIAIAALAGAAGAAMGAVIGGLICGQVAAMARMWLDSKDKPNKGFYILDQPAITGDHKMKCMLFGDEIVFKPEIKNWWQALAIGGANLITGIMEGMMYGAMVGMGGAAVGGVRTLISQGGVQLSRQAGLNFLKTNGVNVLKNAGTGIFGDWGMKAADGSVGFLNKYGYTGSASVTDFTSAVGESAMGDITAVKNVFSGNGSADDFMALVMLFAPGGKSKKGEGASSSTHAEANSNKSNDGADTTNKQKDTDDGTVHKSHSQDNNSKSKKDGDAYENGGDPPGTRRNSAGRLIDAKTGRFVKDPNSKSKSKKPKYNRSKAERRKALLRDADDPNSGLSPEARKYIKDNNGNKVPDKKYNKDYKGETDFAVHHKEPLYSEKSIEGKQALDKANNMETIPKNEHLDTHRYCGNTYHKFGPSNE